ncbi:uncharacterized protein LOC103703202 isoform X1 [Phoenix dactylifera]|uniref:Uncharacterized protein LOC103703202 isoform X1 n=1 Tax=Phoenix dactylifera TaxID=42345 RepID=A0A8B9ALU8_PHODC|nr:uncharacterized protein LOC103703202 isoform X1 [Phoenix dactylifera]
MEKAAEAAAADTPVIVWNEKDGRFETEDKEAFLQYHLRDVTVAVEGSEAKEKKKKTANGHGPHVRAQEQARPGPRRPSLRRRIHPRPAPLLARHSLLLLYLRHISSSKSFLELSCIQQGVKILYVIFCNALSGLFSSVVHVKPVILSPAYCMHLFSANIISAPEMTI